MYFWPSRNGLAKVFLTHRRTLRILCLPSAGQRKTQNLSLIRQVTIIAAYQHHLRNGELETRSSLSVIRTSPVMIDLVEWDRTADVGTPCDMLTISVDYRDQLNLDETVKYVHSQYLLFFYKNWEVIPIFINITRTGLNSAPDSSTATSMNWLPLLTANWQFIHHHSALSNENNDNLFL